MPGEFISPRQMKFSGHKSAIGTFLTSDSPEQMLRRDFYNFQSISAAPFSRRNALILEKGRLPKKPR